MKPLAYALLALVAAMQPVLDVAAHGYKRKSLEVIHPWTSEKPEPGGRDAIVGMTLRNSGTRPEHLIGVRSGIAERAVILSGAAGNGTDGAMKGAKGPAMQIEIKPGQEVHLKASAAHVRLIGLKKALTAYDTLPVTLLFENAGRLDIDVMVEEIVEAPKG